MPTIAHQLQSATQLLEVAGIGDSCRLDAECLLAAAIQRDRTFLYTYPEYALSAGEQAAFNALLARRQKGEPIAYLQGSKEFWSLNLRVNPQVLIPRPDTEALVEYLLGLSLSANTTAIDLGTGSGAIALALAAERSAWQVYASDASADALLVASSNRADMALPNVHLFQAVWLQACREQCFDLVVSNPPYIDVRDDHLQQGDVRFEPKTALVAGEAGMQDLQEIALQARRCLRSGGRLAMEHGYQQGDSVATLLDSLGFEEIYCGQDLAGQPRFTVAIWPGAV